MHGFVLEQDTSRQCHSGVNHLPVVVAIKTKGVRRIKLCVGVVDRHEAYNCGYTQEKSYEPDNEYGDCSLNFLSFQNICGLSCFRSMQLGLAAFYVFCNKNVHGFRNIFTFGYYLKR